MEALTQVRRERSHLDLHFRDMAIVVQRLNQQNAQVQSCSLNFTVPVRLLKSPGILWRPTVRAKRFCSPSIVRNLQRFANDETTLRLWPMIHKLIVPRFVVLMYSCLMRSLPALLRRLEQLMSQLQVVVPKKSWLWLVSIMIYRSPKFVFAV